MSSAVLVLAVVLVLLRSAESFPATSATGGGSARESLGWLAPLGSRGRLVSGALKESSFLDDILLPAATTSPSRAPRLQEARNSLLLQDSLISRISRRKRTPKKPCGWGPQLPLPYPCRRY